MDLVTLTVVLNEIEADQVQSLLKFQNIESMQRPTDTGAGSIGGSALQVGQALLAGAGGSLRRMAMQPVASLTATAGIGMARAVTVHAALEPKDEVLHEPVTRR